MVEPGSPAEKEGLFGGSLPIKIAGEEFLFGGDIITEINKKSLDQPETYINFLKLILPQKTATEVKTQF